ncbi:MAG: hypothetical protein ACREMY_05250, partial [bacterium]
AQAQRLAAQHVVSSAALVCCPEDMVVAGQESKSGDAQTPDRDRSHQCSRRFARLIRSGRSGTRSGRWPATPTALVRYLEEGRLVAVTGVEPVT